MKLLKASLNLLLPAILALPLATASAAPLRALAPRIAFADQHTGANEILDKAKTQAAAEHKQVLAVFSASWCGPCHLFERFLDDPATGPIMNQAFVIARFDVGERPSDKRHADTPGAEKLRASLGGAQAGYPFFVMLTDSGRPIVDSIRPGQKSDSEGNVGYPALPVEIDWFLQMLHQAAPTLSPQQTATVRHWLQQRAHS